VGTREIREVRREPRTATTVRLATEVERYGIPAVAKVLGIDPATLTRWLGRNVPRSWVSIVDAHVGRVGVPGLSPQEIQAAEKRRTVSQRQLLQLERRRALWNARHPEHQLDKSTAERLYRAGLFAAKLDELARLERDAGKGIPRTRAPRALRFGTEKLPHLHVPRPTRPGDPRLQSFLQVRADAIANQRGSASRLVRFKQAKFDRTIVARSDEVRTLLFYGRVESFINDVPLERLALRILAQGQRLWKQVAPVGGRKTLSLRVVFSGAGKGNPFYKDAWFDNPEQMEFFTGPHIDASTYESFAKDVCDLFNSAARLGEKMLLFLETYQLSITTR